MNFRLWGSYFLFLFCVLFFCLVFNAGWIFTEWGFFSQFFRSMLTNFDFNIIDQVETARAWLVTKTYYHPSVHPESQMGLMLPAYIFEYVTNLLVTTKSIYWFEFVMTGFLMNIFSIFTGFYFCKKSADILGIKLGKVEMAIFYFGCPLFFFSAFQATVVEVAAFPLLSYLCYIYLACKKGVRPKSILPSAAAIGFLFITKVTFWPLAALIAFILTEQEFKNKRWASLIQFWLIIGALAAANSINMWMKYGTLSNAVPPLDTFYDFSFYNISMNLIYGFFPKGGLLFASPIYAFSAFGLFAFLLHSFKKKVLNLFEVVFCLGWFGLAFFSQVILMGYIVEDHLPGRINLAVAPLLVIGMVYLKQSLEVRFKKGIVLVLAAFSVWHIVITFFYLNVIQISSYVYEKNMIPSAEVFNRSFKLYADLVGRNLDIFISHLPHILVFTFIVSTFAVLLQKDRIRPIVVKAFPLICVISFVGMSFSNLFNGKKNIQSLKDRGFFEGKVVGSGKELYYIDYILDFAKMIEGRKNPDFNKKLKIMIDEYYVRVAQQVIVSTPELDKAIQEKSPDFSFSINVEKEKEQKSKNHF